MRVTPSMLVLLLSGAAVGISPAAIAQEAGSPAPAERAAPNPDLHKMLMDKLDSMDSENHGIFHDDVTDMLAPFFPVGQSMKETKRVLSEQHLGHLHRFMGTNDPGMGTMFVTKAPLMSHVYGNVAVVLDFDYDGSHEGDMTLKQMKAYLRAENM